MTKQRRFFGVLGLALIASGCSKGNLVSVQGIVTLEGQPVQGASVTFVPEENGGYSAGGWTDKNGVFNLTTYSEGDGALPGNYRVIITKTASDPSRGDKRQIEKMRIKGKALRPINLLPASYGDPSKTPLRWRVPDDGKKTLELTSSGPSSP
jgi:hypothetical protein